jgi:outer membrane protein assembly factor BamB
MYFAGERTQPERILTNYLFSGSVFFLCLLLLMNRFPERSTIRVIVGLIIMILVALIVKYLPRQNYFTTSDLFKSWVVLLVIPGVILPLLLSIILIFKTIVNKYKFRPVADNSLNPAPLKSMSSRFMIFSVISAFLLGISGFLAVPIITVAKVILSEKLMRIHEPLKFTTFINPDFAYPFFLGVLIIGFLLWLIIEPKKHGYNSKNQFYFNSALLFCSALFFVMNNFSIRKPEYRREILCIDRNSGIIKWKRDCLRGPATGTSTYNTQATPTPLIHDNFVYAYFGSAGIVSADFEGNIKWENTNLPSQSNYGVGASPILCSEGIIILNSTSANPYLTLLDFNSGTQKWKTELKAREGSGGEYRTPILININGQELIMEWSFNRNELAFYEAKTGKVKYMYKPDWGYEGESVTTPLLNEGIIYLSNRLNIVALDIFKLIDGKSPVLWKTELKGKGPDTSSPVLVYGMIFMITDNGFVKCLNSDTGEILWQEKLRGTYFSSPIITGKKVYFSNISGVTTVLECSPHFKKVAENYLPEGIYSTLVPVDGQLFVRTKNTLWCFKKKI